tara:strand:+ start:181 stop:1077 length:897 start_codon:yes stop_codon:yes gene_type:complete
MAFKLSDNFGPLRKNWIKGAIKRPGAFRKKAEEAGMSTKAFAEKVIANKDDYSARTGRQAELAETLMGMNMNESPAKMHTDKHMRRQAEKKARKTQGDAQDIYYEMKSDKMEKEKKKGSPAKKGETYEEFKKRTGKTSMKDYLRENPKGSRGKSSPAKMKSPAKKDGKKGDLLSRGVQKFKEGKEKIKEEVKKVVPKAKKLAKEVKEGYKKTKKLTGTGGTSPAKLKKGSPAKGYKSDAQRKAVHASKADGGKGAPSKLKKDSPAEANKFMAALQAAKDKGEKSFVVNGKSYNVTSKK